MDSKIAKEQILEFLKQIPNSEKLEMNDSFLSILTIVWLMGYKESQTNIIEKGLKFMESELFSHKE